MDTLLVEQHVEQVATPVDQPSAKDRKRWPLWVALTGVLCLLSGVLYFVLSGDDPAPPVASTEATTEDSDLVFEQYMTDEGFLQYGDIESLKRTADGVCSAFDQGEVWMTVFGVAIQSGFSDYDAGAFIAASVAAYCPDNMGALP